MAELTIFHYLPQESIIHNMDGRVKLICMILFTIAAGVARQACWLSLLTLILVITLISSKLPLKKLIIEVRYFLFLIAIVVITHSFSVPGRTIPVLFIPGVTWEGLSSGLFFGWRLILIFIVSTILTSTTSLSLLKDVIEWFLRPIPFIPEAKIGTMFSLTLVLIPLIFDQVSEMQEAQKARCIAGRKNPIQRVLLLIFPLLLHIFIRTDEMGLALESRCYSQVRTRAIFKTSATDWLLLIFSGLVCGLIIYHSF